MNKVVANYSFKIWVFWNNECIGSVVNYIHQQINIQFVHQSIQKEVFVSTVYARCNALDKLELWEDLEENSNNIDKPWVVSGDIIVIMDASEKLRGLPVTHYGKIDFAQYINFCALA